MKNLLLVLIVICAYGCSNDDNENVNYSLDGSTWKETKYVSNGEVTIADCYLNLDIWSTYTFNQSNYSAHSNCNPSNQINEGSYVIDNDTLKMQNYDKYYIRFQNSNTVRFYQIQNGSVIDYYTELEKQ